MSCLHSLKMNSSYRKNSKQPSKWHTFSRLHIIIDLSPFAKALWLLKWSYLSVHLPSRVYDPKVDLLPKKALDEVFIDLWGWSLIYAKLTHTSHPVVPGAFRTRSSFFLYLVSNIISGSRSLAFHSECNYLSVVFSAHSVHSIGRQSTGQWPVIGPGYTQFSLWCEGAFWDSNIWVVGKSGTTPSCMSLSTVTDLILEDRMGRNVLYSIRTIVYWPQNHRTLVLDDIMT